MKKMIIMVLCLAFASLACLETSSNELPIEELTAVATCIEKVATFTAPAMVKNATVTAAPVICARVIANTAQNLRSGADPDYQILTQMAHGETVQVIGQSNADWWHVKRGGDIGFARSIYLEVVRCDDDNP